MGADFWIVIKWWGTLFLIGAIAFPLSKKILSSWYDRGYLFAKALGLMVVTFIVYVAAMTHLMPFTVESIGIALIVVFGAGLFAVSFPRMRESGNGSPIWSGMTLKIIIEELFFLLALIFWSWVKGHEASIHGLEKFMDFGFMKSIYNSLYFPAPDIWYAGLPINYYYFGHTVVALLSKLSGVNLIYAFNLMLATIFAFCLTMSFAISVQIFRIGLRLSRTGQIIGGLFTAFLVTLAGNMQTIYAFTKGYTGEDVKPFWQLLWTVSELKSRFPEGLERYWYANATRFIPFTIHEFPSYSFVVSDVHGHVMSIPFILLGVAFLIQMFVKRPESDEIAAMTPRNYVRFGIYGMLVAVLLMTNALDGPIYLGLFLILYVIFNFQFLISKKENWKKQWKHILLPVGGVIGAAVVFSVPFMSKFSSFVSGVALNCPPAFLANRKLGPLLFEGVEKCQHSPFWMVWLLWGFFIYCGIWFIARISNFQFPIFNKQKRFFINMHIVPIEKILLVFFVFSVLLIIFPEFFYFKDIYPQHFRSNTMFKLGYQAFMLFSFVSGYAIVAAIQALRKHVLSKKARVLTMIFLLLVIPQVLLVSIYPLFSVRSYFDSLRMYKGLDGLMWLNESYPEDYAGIQYLNSEFANTGDPKHLPVIVEADGDSYTDYARFSAFTGFPAVIGWPVHEWLWRGSYDVVAPRREEVRVIYESEDRNETRFLLDKYNVTYIIVGGMERKKFSAIQFDKLNELASVVFQKGDTTIYRIYK